MQAIMSLDGLKTFDARGKAMRAYPQELVMTPCERLCSMPGSEELLMPGVTFEALDERAARMIHQGTARRLKRSRERLFGDFRTQEARLE